MSLRKKKKSKKQPWQGAAKSMALGLMCLASFVAAPNSSAEAADNLTISGAQGGGTGGAGAGATFNFGATSYTSGLGIDFRTTWNGWNILLGGAGQSGYVVGGASDISTTNPVTAGNIDISSGKRGDSGAAGDGGPLTFSAGEVTAQSITLKKEHGDLNVSIASLNVAAPATTLTLDSTSAASGANGVGINGLSFMGNAGLTVTQQNAGSMAFGGNLTVHGKNNTLNSPIAFNAAGKTLHFYLPSSIAAGNTLLTVTGSPLNISGSTIGVGLLGRGTPLALGDSVTLIDASANGLTADAAYTNNTTGMVGISKVYEFDLSADTKKLLATVTEVRASDPAVRKSPAEGKAAAVTLLTQGADLAAGPGLSNARTATHAAGTASRGGAGAEGLGVTGFGATSGGSSRYSTGSHVDVDSLSFVVGLAKLWQVPSLDVLGGVFFETGFGSYNSHNRLQDGGSLKGDGNSRYVGGGLMGRVDLTQSALRGLYAEASLRLGALYADYNSGDLPNTDLRASYDTSATYYGAHTGFGYIWFFTDQASLDLYAKYFWAHTTANSVTILGDDVHFEAVNSHRTRLGGRLSCALNEYITPYIGAAWDYEFDGKAKSVVAGEGAPAPSLKGSTGVGELGLSWQPSAESAVSIDAGIQGYTGMREGVSGSLQFKYEF